MYCSDLARAVQTAEEMNRLTPFYKQIMESDEERILIVSHGTTLSFLQSMIMGYSFEKIAGIRFNGSGGSISRFAAEPDGRIIACYINQRIF